jgi:CRP-like cAMP-binding protein
VVVREGEAGDEAFIVTQGSCEAVKEESGRAVALRVMGPGAVFGEAALLSSQPRTATVVAREELTVLVVARQALEGELFVDSWSGMLVRALAERFRDLDVQLAQARRREREAGIVQWVREQVLTEGRRLAERVWEADWAAVLKALPPARAINEEILAAILERASGVVLDRARGVITVGREAGR